MIWRMQLFAQKIQPIFMLKVPGIYIGIYDIYFDRIIHQFLIRSATLELRISDTSSLNVTPMTRTLFLPIISIGD